MSRGPSLQGAPIPEVRRSHVPEGWHLRDQEHQFTGKLPWRAVATHGSALVGRAHSAQRYMHHGEVDEVVCGQGQEVCRTLRRGESMVRSEYEARKASPSSDSGKVGMGNPHLDARSLDMTRIVVERIDADRSLFNVANDNLKRERQVEDTLSLANEEWEQILKRPWSEIRAILLDESDEGKRLRSTHPFRGIVTEAERLEIIARHPPPWPHVPYDPARVPPEIMEKLLSEGTSLSPVDSASPKRLCDSP